MVNCSVSANIASAFVSLALTESIRKIIIKAIVAAQNKILFYFLLYL
jgi:hypothetical protein